MKRVGTLTFSNTVNYGASLQACALCKTIESLGCECEILNYSNKELDDRELGTSFSLKPSGAVRYFLRRGFEGRRIEAFARFAKTNLNLTEKLSRSRLIERAKKLDCVFIGSDQVFNPRVNGHDPAFLGEGISSVTNLASYAASLGDATVEAISACDRDAANRLKEFVGLSVREPSSKAVLQAMGLDPVFMPDPTLLLSGRDWSQVASSDGLAELPESYVLLYTLNSEQQLINRSREVANQLGVSVVCVHYNTKKIDGVVNLRDAGPSAFLRLIENAEYVCTDSFHGACFSLNFNKPFVVKTSDAAVQSNIRITDLLERYGLGECLYRDGSAGSIHVDFTHANSVLEGDREAARAFIADCIGL